MTGFAMPKARKPPLSSEARAAKAAAAQAEREALLASGAAKKIDDAPSTITLNKGRNQAIAQQEAANQAAAERQERYLRTRAWNHHQQALREARERRAAGVMSLEDRMRR